MTKDGNAIFASALGTVFERRDFYLYATRAPRVATKRCSLEIKF
jgi:hypothetical protein